MVLYKNDCQAFFHPTHLQSTKAMIRRQRLWAGVLTLLSYHNHAFGSLKDTVLQYLKRFQNIAHFGRIVYCGQPKS